MKKQTVFLLVEDDANDVQFFESAFQRERSWRLVCLGNGPLAMRYLNGDDPYSDRCANPPPDVILLDLKKPQLSGVDFIRWLRSSAPQPMALLPVIVLSSLTLPGDVMQAYMVGANAYITKPLDWRYFRCQVHDLGIYWADPAQKPCAAERVESQGSAELAGCSAEHESSTTGKLFEGHSSYPWKV